jgi:hypothetical protein
MDIHPAITYIVAAQTIICHGKDITVMHGRHSRNAVWNGVRIRRMKKHLPGCGSLRIAAGKGS